MIDIIGVPFDLCGQERGSSLGPGALRIAGIEEALLEVNQECRDLGDLPIARRSDAKGLRNFEPLLQTLRALKARVAASLANGALPLVLGGEHTLAIGGIAAALEQFDGDLTILWLDAHADLNTPAVSPSGNLHGMPLAALSKQPDGHPQWAELCALSPCTLPIGHIGWIGLRAVDEGEKRILATQGPGFVSTLHEVDRYGLIHELDRMHRWLCASGRKHLYVSFDVDVMDPILAPGTGTAVRGGLTYRETQLIAEYLREKLDEPENPYRLAGIEVVETNPIPDRHNETAVMAVEWVASLFGKTILGEKP